MPRLLRPSSLIRLLNVLLQGLPCRKHLQPFSPPRQSIPIAPLNLLHGGLGFEHCWRPVIPEFPKPVGQEVACPAKSIRVSKIKNFVLDQIVRKLKILIRFRRQEHLKFSPRFTCARNFPKTESFVPVSETPKSFVFEGCRNFESREWILAEQRLKVSDAPESNQDSKFRAPRNFRRNTSRHSSRR